MVLPSTEEEECVGSWESYKLGLGKFNYARLTSAVAKQFFHKINKNS